MRFVFWSTYSVLTVLCIGVLVANIPTLRAQVRQSTSYQIHSDSVNTGGALSSSANYSLEDTTGEQATGLSDSTSYSMRAGYQQMQEIYLAISSPASDVSMSTSIGGLTGGTAVGSTAVKVTTDNAAGYQLLIAASADPAMQSGSASLADYVPAGDPDFTFVTNASDAHFGFSPEGEDIAQRFHDLAGVCNAGTGDTVDACWDGLTTSNAEIARRTNANHPNGSTTTIKFRVGVGSSAHPAPGTYVATSTVTVLPL